MSAALQLVLSTLLAASPAACSWAHPGANPYRGDPAHALADFDLPEATRAKLRTMMAAHGYTDVATITRDDIVGARSYTDLREMHSGGGRMCHGSVDRSAWSAKRRERGLVYCADDACVIVPTICNNVSLVSREPARVAPSDDGPIDIEPAAGPPATPAGTPPDAISPQDFIAAPGGGSGLPDTPDSPGGGEVLVSGGGPVSGGGLCCEVGPGIPVGPGEPGGPGGPLVNSPPAIPEAPTWTLLLAGLALTFGCRARRR